MGKTHQCPTHIPLHVIQELVEAVHNDLDPDYSSSEEDTEAPAGQVVMAIQHQTEPAPITTTHKKNRTLRFRGFVGTQEVLILLDSGSAGTFVSPEIAAKV
jgi:hypothetical protein